MEASRKVSGFMEGFMMVFYIFSYLLSKAIGCFSGCLMSSAGLQKLFRGIYSAFKCGVSGDFWGSQEGCQGPFRPSGRNKKNI